MYTILFQGDSITDACRVREESLNMGQGYPTYAAARLGLEKPNAYRFYNRGISGNRIVDIYARIKSDIINLKPDYMSLLIGVNDVWHEFSYQNGVATAKFEKIYGMLIEELQEALPEMKIVLMEPFVLSGYATVDKYAPFRADVEEKAAATRRIAEKYNLPLIELQADLDKMAEGAPEGYWLCDGVHPSVYGHQFIADKWIEKFNEIVK